MKSPDVSVILPTFNRASVLSRAVESVKIQRDIRWELIIVDDGSTDNSAELLHQYESQSQIKVVYQENKGVSAARNAGFRLAQGEYIAFIDSDDAWCSGKLQQQVRFFSETDFSIQQTLEIWIRNGKRVNPPVTLLKQGGDIFSISLERCMITPSSVCMKRDLFERMGGFDEDFPVCEDYELWLRISAGCPVGLIEKELLTRYGGHPDQLSSKFPALDEYRILAMIKLLRETGLTGKQRTECLTMLGRKLNVFKNGCLKRGRQDKLQWCREIEDTFLPENP